MFGRLTLGWLVSSAALAAAPAQETTALDRLEQQFRAQRHVTMLMRDGIRLYGHVLFPRGVDARRGTVLIRSPYDLATNEASEREGAIRAFLERNYIVVLQNERGRYFSEGDYETLTGARQDGIDTLEWITAQAWSNGRIATFGCSSSAENQLPLAAANHPAHVAAIVMSSAVAIDRVGDLVERGQVWRGGAFQQDWIPWFYDYGHLRWPRVLLPDDASGQRRYIESFAINTKSAIAGDWPARARGFPQIDAMRRLGGPLTELETWMRRDINDPSWSRKLVGDRDDIRVPTLWMSSWFDYAPHMELALFEIMRRRREREGASNQKMIMAPGFHCAFESESKRTRIGERVVRNATLDYIKLMTDWLDAYLSDTSASRASVEAWPAVRSHTIGANRWSEYTQWPPANGSPFKLYLDATGSQRDSFSGVLQSAPPAQIRSRTFAANPTTPVQTRGGGGYPGDLGDEYALGSVSQSAVEQRPDVLLFTTTGFQRDVHLSGRVQITLNVSSDAPDVDVTAKLASVDRLGRSLNLVDTVLRLRYRNGYEKAEWLQPNVPTRVELPAMAIDAVIRRGERLRLQIAASNWPKYSLNTQDGKVPETSDTPRTASLTIISGGDQPSVLLMQVIDDADERGKRNGTSEPGIRTVFPADAGEQRAARNWPPEDSNQRPTD